MITAIVPARSGSKRYQGKNIRPLAGRPLVFHTLDALLGHELITEILFTTDSDEYIDIVRKEYGDRVRPVQRPEEYGGDKVKVYDEIRRLRDSKEIATDWYMLCLPTCPLRDHKVVAEVLEVWKSGKTPVFTGVEYDFPIQFAFSINDANEWQPVFDNSPMITGNTRSQDIGEYYRPNGAIYLQHVKNLDNKTFYINAKVHLMSREQSVDIDNEIDFRFCEVLLAAGD